MCNTGHQRIFPDEPHLAGPVLGCGLEQLPVAHYGFAARLAVDRPARTMIVRFAFPGAVIDMAEDAESQFRILVEDFAVGHAIVQMRGDEIIVLQYLPDQRADFLAALDAGILREDAMTLVGKLLKRIHRMNSTIRDLLTAYRRSISDTTNLAASGPAGDTADPLDDLVPVVDVAVQRVNHDVLNAGRLIAACSGVSWLPCQPSPIRTMRRNAASERAPNQIGIGRTGRGLIVISVISAGMYLLRNVTGSCVHTARIIAIPSSMRRPRS